MKEKVIQLARNVGSTLAKNSPVILTGIGIAGVITTAIFASQATLKAKEKLEEIPEDADWKEKAKHVAPLYIKTAISATIAIISIAESHRIEHGRQMAVASLCAATETVAKEFEDKVVETIGEKKTEKIKSEITEDKVIQSYPKKKDYICDTGHGDQIFMDMWSGQVFKSDIEYIRRSVNLLNERINQGEFINMNELYYDWGVSNAKFGDVFGWDVNANGIIKLRFTPVWLDEEHTMTCTAIDHDNEPTFAYSD